MAREIRWAIEDHLCRNCGGRILRSVSGTGPTIDGNPIFQCADCGKSSCSMGPEEICWCGFHHRGQEHMQGMYVCLPFSILRERPELDSAFWRTGCDPTSKRAQVGVILASDARTR